MPELSLKQRITRWLRSQPEIWVHKGDIERQSILAGYLASTGVRRTQELVEEGFLEQRENEKGHAEFKAIQSSNNFI